MSDDSPYADRTYEPLPRPSGMEHPPEKRVAHALEAIAAALCRIDHRLENLIRIKNR